MLMGEFRHSLDSKGRVNFPSKLRDALGSHFVITRGLDGCLFVYGMDEWEKMGEKIANMPMSKGRNFQRYFFGSAIEVEPDKQGRVMIPANLRNFAGLEKEIVILGTTNRAEIWDAVQYEQMDAQISSEVIAQEMEQYEF